MMKRGISFVTSLLMTASLTLVPMEEALIAPSSVVFAADAAPIIKVKDVTVPVGEDSVLVPVTIEGKDVASVTLSVEVNSKDSKEANPEITGVKDGKFAGAQAQDASKASASNIRNILWVDDTDTEGKEFKNEQVFLVEVKLPKDAKENSQYTVKISSVSIANSERKDYKLTDECDYEGIITVGSKVLDGFTTRMDDQKVKAGKTVDVPMYIKCSESLGSIIGHFEITGGAEIVGLSSDGAGFDSNDYTFAENDKSLFNWTVYEYGGYKISGEQQLVSVQVKIPSNAKAGDVFTLSLSDDFDVALGNRATVNPENYASAKLTVEADEVKTAATLTIGSEEVDVKEATVDLPVYVKTVDKNGIASVVANFKISNSDKKEASIKAIEAGAAIDANDFSVSENYPSKALWVVNSTTDSFFTEDNAQLFILKITLPENREVGDIFTIDFDGKADVADSTKKSVSADQKSGTIKIVKSADETTAVTTAETTAVTTTTTAKDTTAETTTTTAKDTTAVTTVTTVTTAKDTTGVTTTGTTAVTSATTAKDTTVVTSATTPDTNVTTVVTTDVTGKDTNATTTTSSDNKDQKDEKVVLNIGTVSGHAGDLVELQVKATAIDLKAVTGDFIFENGYAQIEEVISEIGSNMSGSKNVNKIVWTYEDSATESPDYNDDVWITLKVRINKDIPENVSSISVTFEGTASTYAGKGKIVDSVLEVNDGKINIEKTSAEETTTASNIEETTAAITTVSETTTAETTTTAKETTAVTTTTAKETTAVTTTTPKETTAVTTTTPKETTAVTTTTAKETTAVTTTTAKETTAVTTTTAKETTAETTTTAKETTAVTTTTPEETTAVTTTKDNTTDVTTTPKETTAVTTTKDTTPSVTTDPNETTSATTKDTAPDVTTSPKETTASTTSSEQPTTEVTSDESELAVTTSIKWESNEDYNYIKQYPNTKFYFAFEKEFDLSNLSVEVNTVDSTGKTSKMVIPSSELVLSYTYQVKDKDGNTTDVTIKNCNPNTVYYDTVVDEDNKTVQEFRDNEDGKKFKYSIDVSYQNKKVGSFNVYIGEMGDVNLDHEVDPEDGTYILKISNALSFDFLKWEITHTMEPFMTSKIEKFVKDKNIKLEDGEFDTYMNFAYFLADVTASNPNNKLEYRTERDLPLTEINEDDEIEMVRYVDPEDGTYVLKYYNQSTMNLIKGVDEDVETIWNNLLYKN